MLGYGGQQEFSNNPYGVPGYELLGTLHPDGTFSASDQPGTGYFAPGYQGATAVGADRSFLTGRYGVKPSVSPLVLVAGIVMLAMMVKK